MAVSEQVVVFDVAATRLLVASDPFLSYTEVRRSSETEERWLHRVFELDIVTDPALRSQYVRLAMGLPAPPLD